MSLTHSPRLCRAPTLPPKNYARQSGMTNAAHVCGKAQTKTFPGGRFHKQFFALTPNFCALRPTFAPCAQHLKSFLLAQMLGAERERLAQGAKQFLKSTPAFCLFELLCAGSSFHNESPQNNKPHLLRLLTGSHVEGF